MNSTDFVLIVVIAVICGSVGQMTSRYTSGGWIVHLGVGFVGSLAGVYLSRNLGFPLIYNLRTGGTDFPVIWALLGSVLFVAAVGFFIKPSKH